MSAIQIIFITIINILIILNELDIVRIYQLNGYKFVFNKKIKRQTLLNLLISLMLVLVLIVFNIFNLKYLGYTVLSSVLIISYLLKNIYVRQKISITKRLIRLIIVIFILNFVAIYFLDKYLYILVPIIFLFEYAILVFSNLLNKPLEKLIKLVYISIAKRKIKIKKPLVIAITGSAGKTTIKNILYEFLSLKYSVYKTEKNYNTTWGVIKSIKNLKDQQIFIVEMGARKLGDISEICKIVNPKIGIISNIIKQHLDTFKNIDNVYKTKKELLDYVDVAFLNDNNSYLENMARNCTKNIYGIKQLKYEILNFDGEYLHFKFYLNNEPICLKTKMLQIHNIENILLAFMCAIHLNVEKEKLIKKIEQLTNIDHRFSLTRKNDITIIDDSYNANIEGCMNAIDFLHKFSGRKIIFTQGIVELSNEQEILNEKLGQKIATVADIVILLGVNKEYIMKGLIENDFERNNIIILEDFSKVNEVFSKILKREDVVLIQNDLTDNY